MTNDFNTLENNLTWLDTKHSQHHNLGISRFLFRKQFKAYFIMHYNNVFWDSADYKALIQFLKTSNIKSYNTTTYYPDERVRSFLSTNLTRDQYIASLDSEGFEGFGLKIGGEYTIQYDKSAEWCLIHSRSDNLIFAGVDIKAKSNFVSAFNHDIITSNQIYGVLTEYYGGFEPGQSHIDVLQRYYHDAIEKTTTTGKPPKMGGTLLMNDIDISK